MVLRPFRNESQDKTVAQNEGCCIGFHWNLLKIGSNYIRLRFEKKPRDSKNSSEGRVK